MQHAKTCRPLSAVVQSPSINRLRRLIHLQVIKGADHNLDHLDAAVAQTEGQTIQQKAARFFGLMK
jgi:hypothetical protein